MEEDIRRSFTLDLNRQHEGFNSAAMETILKSNDLILSGGLTAVKADSDIEFAQVLPVTDISNSVAVVSCTNSQPVVTHPLTLGVGFGKKCSQFAPPSLNFSGCSVNVYTEPVVTSGSFHHSSTYNFGLTAGDVENL